MLLILHWCPHPPVSRGLFPRKATQCNERGWLSQTSAVCSQGIVTHYSLSLICAFRICYSRNLCSDKAAQSETEERPAANVSTPCPVCPGEVQAGSCPAIISPPLDWHLGRHTVTGLVTLWPQFSLHSVKHHFNSLPNEGSRLRSQTGYN